MSESFTKLFSSLIHSTIWREPNHVRIVWVTMLAMVNQHGEVEASLPGLADAARVTIEECEEALLKLSQPDRYSRSKAHEGRRIKDIDGGWFLLNHDDYRRRLSADDQREKTAERVRRHREKNSEFIEDVTSASLPTVSVTLGNASNDMQRSDAEANTEKGSPVVPAGDMPAPKAKPARSERRKPRFVLPDDWKPNPGHLERARGLGLNCRVEFEKFKNHAAAGGRVMADWNAAFTTWLLNAQSFAPGGLGTRGAQGRSALQGDDERARARNNLLDDAKAGRFGPRAKARADSGQDIGKLVDELESYQRKRQDKQLAEQSKALLEGSG